MGKRALTLVLAWLERETVPTVASASRLDAIAWTTAALDALALGGIEGVRVELLAKQLGVTKGSFYWHFKDRDALLLSMLDQWRRRATIALIERMDRSADSPRERLRRLLRLPILGQRSAAGAEIELSMRLWGRSDVRARAVLREVDDLRLRHISHLLRDAGVGEAEAQPRAVMAYSYIRVAATLVAPDQSQLMEQCEALLIGDIQSEH